MKKVFSALLALCMVLSMTAFAATDAKIDVTATDANGDVVTEAAVGDVITFTVKTTGDTTGLVYAGAGIGFKFDPTQLSFNEDTADSDFNFNGSCGVSVADSGDIVTFQLAPNPTNKNDAGVYFKNADDLKGAFVIGSIEATILDGAKGKTIKFEAGDVSMTYAEIKESTAKKVSFQNSEDVETVNSIPTITVKGDDPTPEKPVISVDPSNPTTGVNNGVVDIVKNDETGAYSVNVKAPIGKKAVIYLNGVAQAGTEISGTATADTTIKVEYVDDDAAVITYPIVYQDADCAVVFGKGTIAEGDKYGIKVTDTTGASKAKEATVNASGIFGVQFNYVNAAGKTAPNGTYKAQAFVNDVYGAEISFTK